MVVRDDEVSGAGSDAVVPAPHHSGVFTSFPFFHYALFCQIDLEREWAGDFRLVSNSH